jgi:hypothetical protein
MEDGWCSNFSRSAHSSSWGVYDKDRASLVQIEVECPHHGKEGKNWELASDSEDREIHNSGSYEQKIERTKVQPTYWSSHVTSLMARRKGPQDLGTASPFGHASLVIKGASRRAKKRKENFSELWMHKSWSKIRKDPSEALRLSLV